MRTLSARQRHILNYVTRGLTNKEIAAELGVSEQCVKSHVSRLFDRYGVEGRVELVSYAASLGYADERWTATARSPLATILRRVDGLAAMVRVNDQISRAPTRFREFACEISATVIFRSP